MQPEYFERPLDDDPVGHVLVTHGFLGEKQAFESDRFYRNAIELNRLGVLAQCVVSLPVGIEHETHRYQLSRVDSRERQARSRQSISNQHRAHGVIAAAV